MFRGEMIDVIAMIVDGVIGQVQLLFNVHAQQMLFHYEFDCLELDFGFKQIFYF